MWRVDDKSEGRCHHRAITIFTKYLILVISFGKIFEISIYIVI